MSDKDSPGESPWEHIVEPLLPAEVAPLQRRYIAGLLVPALTDLDLRLRDGIRACGVKVGTEAVAFALVQPAALFGMPAPLLVAIGAPGQNSAELRRFLQEVIRQQQVRAVWGRSDDALLLEALLIEGWQLRPMGPLFVIENLTPPPEQEGILLRHLAPPDLDEVATFFSRIPDEDAPVTDRNELRKALQDRMLDGLFESGVLRAVVQLVPQHDPRYVSLSVSVDPTCRRRGFARLLAADAVSEEIAAGRQVISAFGVHEAGSRHLVESLGATVAATYYLATPPTS